MNNHINELRAKIIGSPFVSKKTGIEGEIKDVSLHYVFIEIETPGAITISTKRYRDFIEIDDELDNLIQEYLKELKIKPKKSNKKEGN